MPTTVRPRIGITMGDPAGIGPECIARSLAAPGVYDACIPVVIGNAAVMESAATLVGSSQEVRKVPSIEEASGDPHLVEVLDPDNLRADEVVTAVASAACGKATWEWRQLANQLLQDGRLNGTVSAPVNTEALKLAGLRTGLSSQSPNVLNFNGSLRIIRFTDHTMLRDVPALVKKDAVLSVLQMVHAAFTRWGFPDLRIAVSGLNPNAVGEEEEQEIRPAVEAARTKGINAVGPLPPDTVFRACADGEYDLVLAMTHDQANIAQKTRKLEGTVSIGDPSDPLIRMTVSHGTAYDIAGKGIASHESILEAIRVAASFAAGRGFPKS